MIDLKKEKFKKIFNNILPNAHAGAKKQWIGETYTTNSTTLMGNILRDWDGWASRPINMTTHCVGNSRPQSNRYMGPEQMFYYEAAKDPSINKEEYLRDVFPTLSESDKLAAYNESVAKLLFQHFVSFHYHPFDPTKETYRFFRDGKNDGEYRTTWPN